MTEAAFLTCDVFTDRPFGGNPLAVFPDAAGLSTGQMQRLARELNLSETAFVLPSERGLGPRVRIFTPTAELAFAGHPTIGTALCLRDLGRAGGGRIVLEEGAGPVAVTFAADGSAELEAPQAYAVEGVFAADLAARALGLDRERIVGDVPVAGTGNPFPLVELADLDALAAATLRPMEKAHPLERHVFLFVRTGENALRARMFAPGNGIPEDPATGSAAAALAGHLAEGAADAEGELRFTLEQGIEMGRPSRITMRAIKRDGRIEAIFVAGGAVPMARGRIRVGG
ncbi:MAG: PhzF family phenazine biosynthesis protein [Geminicoccaceae bacterium]|nr:PhzF family phenazine biosynthesis protein [Geminicoccaceae bacterium]